MHYQICCIMERIALFPIISMKSGRVGENDALLRQASARDQGLSGARAAGDSSVAHDFPEGASGHPAADEPCGEPGRRHRPPAPRRAPQAGPRRPGPNVERERDLAQKPAPPCARPRP